MTDSSHSEITHCCGAILPVHTRHIHVSCCHTHAVGGFQYRFVCWHVWPPHYLTSKSAKARSDSAARQQNKRQVAVGAVQLLHRPHLFQVIRTQLSQQSPAPAQQLDSWNKAKRINPAPLGAHPLPSRSCLAAEQARRPPPLAGPFSSPCASAAWLAALLCAAPPHPATASAAPTRGQAFESSSTARVRQVQQSTIAYHEPCYCCKRLEQPVRRGAKTGHAQSSLKYWP